MSPSTNQASSVDTEGQSFQHTRADGGKADNMAGQPSNETITIVLATTIPSVFLIIMAAVILHRVRRRKARFLKRGITPIDDEEIESWRVGRNNDIDEKSICSLISPIAEPKRAHHPSNSVCSVQKPPSVIVYQNNDAGYRQSGDQSPWAYGKCSIDLPKTPILARAPNSRPGLTDQSIQGADAFVHAVTVKRQPSRLTKIPPGTSRHSRSRSTRSNSFGANTTREPWYTQSPDCTSPRYSGDTYSKSSPSSRSGHRATLSSPTTIPRHSYDEEVVLAGLSPRPLIHRSEIGRAIG